MRAKLAISTLILAAAFSAGTVQARAALSDCDSNRRCLWGNNDYVWKIADRAHGNTSYTSLTGDGNNEMDSWANKSGVYTGCTASSSTGGGDKQVMPPASRDNNVSPVNSDEVSSFRTRGGC